MEKIILVLSLVFLFELMINKKIHFTITIHNKYIFSAHASSVVLFA